CDRGRTERAGLSRIEERAVDGSHLAGARPHSRAHPGAGNICGQATHFPMKLTRAISTVEVHTGGEPFRIVTSGVPRMPGNKILPRRKWLAENCDELRRGLMFEPRGHADMYGGLLTEPVSEGADFGVIFMHNIGYSSHCGHGVIALSTAAVELG